MDLFHPFMHSLAEGREKSPPTHSPIPLPRFECSLLLQSGIIKGTVSFIELCIKDSKDVNVNFENSQLIVVLDAVIILNI